MQLQYGGVFHGARLMDELLARFPQWRVQIGDEFVALFSVQTTDSAVLLTVPDGSDSNAIWEVVDAHDPTRLSPVEQARAERMALLETLRDQNAEPLVAADYDDQPGLIRRLADKIAWLERELADLRDQ